MTDLSKWVCVVVLSTCSTFALAQAETLRTISVSGESVVFVAPDEVGVTFGVETFNAILDESKSANDTASATLLDAIRKLGIEEKHIQTGVLSVSIDYVSNTRRTIDGYVCGRTYVVTLKDVTKFETLVDVALKNGANQLMGFEFRSTELRKHRDQARAMAIRAAKEKAVALATELDCTIGKPRTISESSSGYYGPSFRGVQMQNSAQYGDSAGDGGESLPLGQIGIRASVSVTFDLDPSADR